METWTYGAELEFGDLDRSKALPEGCKWDVRDYSMVNSNGIAVDPKGVLYGFGGEINTRPTDTIAQQVALFRKILKLYPEAAANYRSNLHIHIRVPGLSADLKALKKLQAYVLTFRPVIELVEPIPEPTREEHATDEEYKGARRRWRRRRVSHHTFVPPNRVEKQLRAKSLQEFFEAEVPRSKAGQVMWHAQPRAAVNLRQLRETDTIEFRHFPLSKEPKEFEAALRWCDGFLRAALNDGPAPAELWSAFKGKLPAFPSYVHWMEERYRRTVHDGTLSKEEILKNIQEIENAKNTGTVPW